uniref:WAT1-related protein n=1 Tax=Steinernema glaseri TaxID=37863 RepID=A0A1I7ZVP0_9BILA
MVQLHVQSTAALPKTNKHYSVHHLFASTKLTLYSIAQIVCGIAMNIIGSVMFYNIQDLVSGLSKTRPTDLGFG